MLKDAGVDSPEWDAGILISEFCGVGLAEQLANPAQIYNSPKLKDALLRRIQREPLQYILGKWDFCDEVYSLCPDCLIPRPETEELVRYACDILPKGAVFADLCTGSGCIAISILAKRDDLTAVALDISENALATAKENALQNGVNTRLQLIQLDILSGIPKFRAGSFDVIISNPPYIKSADIPSLAPELLYEPKIALDGGADGLIFYRRILEHYLKYLKNDGFFLFEIGYENSLTCKTRNDLSGNPRMSIISRAAKAII